MNVATICYLFKTIVNFANMLLKRLRLCYTWTLVWTWRKTPVAKLFLFCFFFSKYTKTTGITMVFICCILCISSLRSLYLLFFSISFRAMFLSDGTVISISLWVEFTKFITTMSGLFTVINSLVSIWWWCCCLYCASHSLAHIGTICL